MAKRNIEIEDSLPERVESAIDDVKEQLISYLDENQDIDGVPCISNDLDYSGAIHEIIDGSVPIYTKEIDDTYYLYGRELDEAYEQEGIGDGKEENHIAVTIYCYISQAVHEWYRNNAEDVCNEWRMNAAIKKVGTLTIDQCFEAMGMDPESPLGDNEGLDQLRERVIDGLKAESIEPETILDL